MKVLLGWDLVFIGWDSMDILYWKIPFSLANVV